MKDITTKEQILEDNQLLCVLTNTPKRANSREENLQSTIRMLNEEYGFDLKDIERDVSIAYTDPETERKRRQKVKLVIYKKGSDHDDQDNIIRIAVVQTDKKKSTDKKKGVEATLENTMGALENAEFGLWTNGTDIHFLQRETNEFGFDDYVDLADFPGQGENLEDLDRPDRSYGRRPANDSLVKVFKRAHDYIYGNEGRKKDKVDFIKQVDVV